MNNHNMTQEIITVKEWLDYKDCPIQRNTELHAKKARNKHLKNDSATQKVVTAAIQPNGVRYKLYGHTRAYLWNDGSLKKPDKLFLNLYHVKSIDDIEELYKEFDSQSASETSVDRLHGSLHKYGFSPNSRLIKSGGITSALTILVNPKSLRIDIYKEIEPWLKTLKLIDEMYFSSERFVSGVLAACIITTRIYGEEALSFWVAYNNDNGTKNENGRDGVQALSEFVAISRASRSLTGFGNMKDVCGKAISCYEKYAANQLYTGGVKATNIYQYTEKIKSKNTIKHLS